MLQDKRLGARVIRIYGMIAANNFIQLPHGKGKQKSLGLTGIYVRYMTSQAAPAAAPAADGDTTGKHTGIALKYQRDYHQGTATRHPTQSRKLCSSYSVGAVSVKKQAGGTAIRTAKVVAHQLVKYGLSVTWVRLEFLECVGLSALLFLRFICK